jgi:hypothetical protein
LGGVTHRLLPDYSKVPTALRDDLVSLRLCKLIVEALTPECYSKSKQGNLDHRKSSIQSADS